MLAFCIETGGASKEWDSDHFVSKGRKSGPDISQHYVNWVEDMNSLQRQQKQPFIVIDEEGNSWDKA